MADNSAGCKVILLKLTVREGKVNLPPLPKSEISAAASESGLGKCWLASSISA